MISSIHQPEDASDYALEIAGGEKAKGYEYPWMVRIIKGCAAGQCGGALISPSLVLTAYHCTIQHDSDTKPCDHSDGKRVAILGQPDKEDSSNRIEVPIIRVLYPEHANLDSEDIEDLEDHDFAMYLLKTPIKYSKYIQPICLPRPGQKFDGERVVAAGWGYYGLKTKVSTILRKVNLTVSSKEYAHKKMFGTKLQKNADGHFMDPCGGDSGTDNAGFYFQGAKRVGPICAKIL